MDGGCAGAVPQEVTNVILVDLYEADLHQGAAHLSVWMKVTAS